LNSQKISKKVNLIEGEPYSSFFIGKHTLINFYHFARVFNEADPVGRAFDFFKMKGWIKSELMEGGFLPCTDRDSLKKKNFFYCIESKNELTYLVKEQLRNSGVYGMFSKVNRSYPAKC